MGQVVGETDAHAERAQGKPYTPQNVLATIYHVLGIDPTLTFADYQGRPVILAFTRIFTEKQYCPFCFPHIKALNEQYEQFAERGIELLMITSTDPEQSTIVVQDLGLKMPLLSDESCQTFRAYGTGQALGAPLPAQFVLDAQGRLRYRHLFSFIDHNASPEKLLSRVQGPA